MAYLANIEPGDCANCRIRKVAVRLYNNRNAVMGEYCKPCGKRKLREQEAAEQRGEPQAAQ